MNPYVLATARVDDAAPLSDLMRATFLAAYSTCSTPVNVAAHVDRLYRPDAQARELASPDWHTVLAMSGTEPAGFAQLNFVEKPPVALAPCAQLARFYLLPAHQGKGLAPLLMEALRHVARDRGFDALWLTVWKQSPRAIRFYESQGFVRVGECEFRIGDDPQADWVMRALI
ncbi:GNAT family N-acetyltransferase [Tahibacter amnicola]|uniref:GNAT family N-acetyltransferase n=1 Tax=Tahibacter amnicola TaxID=2976241 RepID=A0ABY6BAZ5_9GAMM|nr:GNAT family N-acetyltransferase [Tahibacter amnicola]UXI66864.1 GNAT family N-acetyltransferase [Tahibacter amnicola]